MKNFIATNDQSLAAKLAQALRKVGIDCPPSHVLSLESAEAVIGAGVEPSNVFFGSDQFSQADFTALRQLCSGQANHAKVVVVAPANSPSMILQAIHCGANDFLDINADLEAELRNLVIRLRGSNGGPSADGRLIVVTPTVGGSGASSLAINLAAAIAQKQSSCCLLDLRLRGGDLATLLKIKPRYTLLSLAEKAHQFDRAMFDQSLVKHECGIHLLASPEPFSKFRQITAHLIEQVIQFSRSRFANVVAELEDMEHAEQVRTLAQADRIVIPLRLDFVALCRTKQCIDHLCANVPRDRIALVASCAGQANELPAKRFAEALGLPVEHQIRYDPAAANAAVNLGMPLVAATPNAKASQGVFRLAEALTASHAAEVRKPRRFALAPPSHWFSTAVS